MKDMFTEVDLDGGDVVEPSYGVDVFVSGPLIEPRPLEIQGVANAVAGDLTSGFETLDRWYSYYGEQTRLAKRAVKVAKTEYKETWAQANLDARVELKDVKVTETLVESHVLCDDRVRRAARVVIEQEAEYERFQNIMEALQVRKDCLINLSADARKEMELTGMLARQK